MRASVALPRGCAPRWPAPPPGGRRHHPRPSPPTAIVDDEDRWTEEEEARDEQPEMSWAEERRLRRMKERASTRRGKPAPPGGPFAGGAPRLARASRPAPIKEYLRLVELGDGAWELQSATAVFRRNARFDETTGECVAPAQEVALAATVHVGDPTYYQGLQEECDADYDAVLFELITGEENLREGRAPESTRGGARHGDEDEDHRDRDRPRDPFLPQLAVALAPTPDARRLADTHFLVPQLDALDLCGGNWYVADMPKQELARLQAEAGEASGVVAGGDGPAPAGPSLPASPALEALVVTAKGRAGGGPLRQATRLVCWLVPCPEAHLLLLDWVWGGGRPSKVLGAMLDSLAGGNIIAARRLAFAQMIVSAQAKGAVGGGADVPVLVERRNDVATECLAKALDAPGVSRVSLLYGGLHMPGLTRRLTETLGLEPSTQRWRAVWRVEPPGANNAVRWAALPLLLFLDGTDWAATITDAAAAADAGAIGAAAAMGALYVVRHGAVYYSLGKWVLEWNRQLFDGSDGVNT